MIFRSAGKSTVIQLLERFYDPAAGRITLAGEPLASYSLKWLRRRMGFISQVHIVAACTLLVRVVIACRCSCRNQSSSPTLSRTMCRCDARVESRSQYP